MVDTEAGWGSGVDAEGLVLLPTGVIVPEIYTSWQQHEGERWKYGGCKVPGQGSGVDAEGPLLPTGVIVPERYIVSKRDRSAGICKCRIPGQGSGVDVGWPVLLSTGAIVPEVRVGKENGSCKGNQVTMSTDTHFILVVLSKEQLPWLQTSQRNGSYESFIFVIRG